MRFRPNRSWKRPKNFCSGRCMRVLISRLSSLGDVVCSLPAAAALKNGFPDCHVTWIVDPRFETIVRCCSAVDEVIALPSSTLYPLPSTQEYDAVLDLQGLLKSAWPIAKSRAKRKFGYHWQREGSWLFSQRVLPDPTSFHVVDQYVDVARAAGGVMDRADFRFAPSQEAIALGKEKLQDKSIEKYIVINPGGGWPAKRWPIERFAKLADLLKEFCQNVVLIGGHSLDEISAAQRLTSLCKLAHPNSLVGETSLAELIALISLCEVHVGGDTGSTHIAAALGKPAIGLYSITSPLRSCPYGQIHNCLYNSESLSAIGVEQVFSKIMENVS